MRILGEFFVSDETDPSNIKSTPALSGTCNWAGFLIPHGLLFRPTTTEPKPLFLFHHLWVPPRGGGGTEPRPVR